jgi:hypothetical protein
MYEQALSIDREIGNRDQTADALSSWGRLVSLEGDTAEAKRRFEEALAIRNELGEKERAAEEELWLAEEALEEEHHPQAEKLARLVRDEFRMQELSDDELFSTTILARALLGQHKVGEARREIETMRTLVTKVQNRAIRLEFTITAARIRAISRKDADVKRSLEATLAEATDFGLVNQQLEARLALGETEMNFGQVDAGRARLEALEKEARAKGFALIANKTAAALKDMSTPLRQ